MSDKSVGTFSVEFLGDVEPEGGRCVYYDECGNTVPGEGEICADCLDRVRHDDSVS